MKQRSAQVQPGDPPTLVDQCRLFRQHPDIRWSYRVHEQILPAVNRLGYRVRFTDICIDHSGYTDPATRAQKDQRNLRLLHLQEAEQPDEAFTLFNLGWVYYTRNQPRRALAYLHQSLRRADPTASIVRKLYSLIAQVCEKLGQPRDALTWCRAGRARFPDDGELLFHEGVLLRAHNDYRGAELAWRMLLAIKPGPHFASLDSSLRGYTTRYHLGVLLNDQGRAAEAAALWRAAVAEQPGFVPAWKQLAGLYLAQANWAAFEDVLTHLPADGLAALSRLVLAGRAHLAQRAFGPARAVLETARERFPNALPPRLHLTAEDQARFGELYQQCREMDGVTYVGPLPQPELAQRLRRVAVLAYPNTYPETSCIAVLEALAAGCVVVTSDLGALPETAAGFAWLVPWGDDRTAYRDRFVTETVAALEQVTAPDTAAPEDQLRRQVDHVNAESTWPTLAEHWTEWLQSLI